MKRIGNHVSALENNERIIIAYYLYQVLKFRSKESILDGENTASFFLSLVSASKKDKLFGEIVGSFVDSFANKLEKLPEDECDSRYAADYFDVDDFEENKEFKFPLYREDNQIQRRFSIKYADLNAVNFYRCLVFGGSEMFSKIVALTFLVANPKSYITNKNKPITIPKKILTIVEDISKAEFLQREVLLTKLESLYILMRYRYATIESLAWAISEDESSDNDLYSKMLNINKSDLDYILRSDQKLFQYGFFSEENEISSALVDCIANQDFNLYFSDLVKFQVSSNNYNLDSFSVSEDKQKVMVQLIQGEAPISILLYGKPGSGKTEFAKSLIHSCDRKIIVFKNDAEAMEKKDVLRKLNCLLSLKRSDTVLIVDEADTLLRTGTLSYFGMPVTSDFKGIVNKMLEESQNKVIWIVNHVDQMEDSTRRRFTVSCKFESMSPEVLQSIAKKKLEAVGLKEDVQNKILDMLGTYHVTGSSVDNVVTAIKCFNKKDFESNDDDELIRNVEIILKENSLLLNGNSKVRETVVKSYDSSVLNVSIPAEKILSMVKNAQTFAEKNLKSDTNNGIRMLFYGLSGTGKTEFARYISQTLKKKILMRRPSDILNKYVGENEKNIKDAFDEAAANDQILLFDEADTFFTDRNLADRGWERNLVNEFLTQMEEFPGVLICTTNLRKIMDPAMLRRFHITVEFKSMEEKGVRKLLENNFSSYTFSENQIKNLLEYDTITPGDFGRLVGNIRFLDESEISSDLIISELCNMQKEKLESEGFSGGRKIGF